MWRYSICNCLRQTGQKGVCRGGSFSNVWFLSRSLRKYFWKTSGEVLDWIDVEFVTLSAVVPYFADLDTKLEFRLSMKIEDVFQEKDDFIGSCNAVYSGCSASKCSSASNFVTYPCLWKKSLAINNKTSSQSFNPVVFHCPHEGIQSPNLIRRNQAVIEETRGPVAVERYLKALCSLFCSALCL